jgi:cobalt-zinc-cadmium efflux system outer membrane protein
MCWLTSSAFAQKSLTWEQAKREFEASNPTLRAAQVGIQESRAQEVTAF